MRKNSGKLFKHKKRTLAQARRCLLSTRLLHAESDQPKESPCRKAPGAAGPRVRQVEQQAADAQGEALDVALPVLSGMPVVRGPSLRVRRGQAWEQILTHPCTRVRK